MAIILRSVPTGCPSVSYHATGARFKAVPEGYRQHPENRAVWFRAHFAGPGFGRNAQMLMAAKLAGGYTWLHGAYGLTRPQTPKRGGQYASAL